jgi:hypothetical protein
MQSHFLQYLCELIHHCLPFIFIHDKLGTHVDFYFSLISIQLDGVPDEDKPSISAPAVA